mgnify:CR=1 FL=1
MKNRGLIITLMILSSVLLGNAFSTIEGMFYPDDLVFRMPDNVEKAECLNVIDGKTIKVRYIGLVETEKEVELIGVDVSQFESNAKILLEKLVKGKTVYLSYDWEGESNGKVKAYVWRYFPNIVGGYHLMVNAILLANGYAVIDTEEYITTKMSAILYETSDTAMKNKYGELKKFASEKPLKYSELEKDMQKFLYVYYWKVEPVAMKTEEEETTEAGTGTFFITKTGEKYHLKDCYTIEGKEVLAVSKEDAERMGYDPCEVCLTQENGTENTENGSDTADNLTEKDIENIEFLYSMIKEAHKRTLKAPSTAEFTPVNDIGVKKLGKEHYVITFYVDAENSFGAKLREYVQVEYAKNPSNGEWEIEDMKID